MWVLGTKYLNILCNPVTYSVFGLWTQCISLVCHNFPKVSFAPCTLLCVNCVCVSVLLQHNNKHSRRAKEKCWAIWQSAAVSLYKLILGIILDELRLNPPAARFSTSATLPLLFQFGSFFIVLQIKVPICPLFFPLHL